MKGTRDKVVEAFCERVREALGAAVVAIYWFGSRARGEHTGRSDYDLLALFSHE